ncbi:MAG: cytochrome C oxidase subunit IV family protein [Myxococcota bacterium]
MSDHSHDHGHGHAAASHEHHEEHIHERSHYVKIWAALVVLFIVSVLGPMIGIKIVTLITAFGIATVKASMVVKYFMHLDVEKRFVHYFLATSLVFMFLFFAAVSPDVMKHHGTHWENTAAQQAVEAGLAAGGGEHGGEHGAAAPEGHH